MALEEALSLAEDGGATTEGSDVAVVVEFAGIGHGGGAGAAQLIVA